MSITTESFASIATNQIAVKASESFGCKYLTLELPEGWDTLQPLINKVLIYDGQNYTFSGWNSDRGEAYFYSNKKVATIAIAANA